MNWSDTLSCKFLLCIAFVFSAFGHIRGQQLAISEDVAEQVPLFDSVRLNSYKDKQEYQYQQKATETSLLTRLWNIVLDYFRSLFSEGRGLGGRIFQLVLVSGAFIILIYFLVSARFRSLFMRSDKGKAGTIRILDEEVHIHTLDDRITRAEDAGDFRSAYRWRYIRLLGYLGQAGFIKLYGNKTNTDYRFEMRSYPAQKDFMLLADAFDYTWYGDHQIGQMHYEDYRNLIDQVTKTVSDS